MALHDLEDGIAVPQQIEQPDGTLDTQISYPSCTRDSHYFMETGGLYLIGTLLLLVHLAFNLLSNASIDNEDTIIFWIGAGASPQLLQDLFGIDDFMSFSPQTVCRSLLFKNCQTSS
jgi:protein transport protein SEC24